MAVLTGNFSESTDMPISWTEQTWPIERVKGYQRNPRKITKEQFERLKSAIESVGFHHPIAVDTDGTIISGNQRYRALCELGHKEVRVSVPSRKLTDKEFRQIVVQGNVSNGIWDTEILSADNDIEELVAWGLSEDWLLGEQKKIEPDEKDDEAPPVPKQAFTKRGDIWLLGTHRLMCGDSTKKEDVDLLMGGEKAVLMQTDPPYGIAYVENAKTKGQSKAHEDIENDNLDGEKLQAFLESTIRAALPHLSENAAFYLWHPMLTQGTFFAAAAAADILIHRQIIWCKPSLVFGRGDYHWQHELCFYGWVKGKRPPFYGKKNQTTLWKIDRETSKEHPTAKPVMLWASPIENHTREGEVIYEPFAGSGSQIIAAEKSSRRCFALELSENYCDVIVRRWQQHTGKTATRQSDGATLPETQDV